MTEESAIKNHAVYMHEILPGFTHQIELNLHWCQIQKIRYLKLQFKSLFD